MRRFHHVGFTVCLDDYGSDTMEHSNPGSPSLPSSISPHQEVCWNLCFIALFLAVVVLCCAVLHWAGLAFAMLHSTNCAMQHVPCCDVHCGTVSSVSFQIEQGRKPCGETGREARENSRVRPRGVCRSRQTLRMAFGFAPFGEKRKRRVHSLAVMCCSGRCYTAPYCALLCGSVLCHAWVTLPADSNVTIVTSALNIFSGFATPWHRAGLQLGL